MTGNQEKSRTGSRRYGHDHKPKPLRYWLIPLVIVVAVIIFLPRVLAFLE